MVPTAIRKRRQIILQKKSDTSQFVIKNLCYWIIIDLGCYCFFTYLGIKFRFYELNALIKYVYLIPYENFIPINHSVIRISEGRWNYCSSLWPAQQQNRDSQKTCYKYKHMRKWMVDFFNKSESRCIKIDRDNSIRITKIWNLFLFPTCSSSANKLTCYWVHPGWKIVWLINEWNFILNIAYE